jgi:hypothetical protein
VKAAIDERGRHVPALHGVDAACVARAPFAVNWPQSFTAA